VLTRPVLTRPVLTRPVLTRPVLTRPVLTRKEAPVSRYRVVEDEGAEVVLA
jgi:hypothetical protein